MMQNFVNSIGLSVREISSMRENFVKILCNFV